MTIRDVRNTPPITAMQALDYEVQSSWWAGEMQWPLLQSLAGKWFGWKVRRKYGRYLKSVLWRMDNINA